MVPSTFERHVQTALNTLVTALLVWVGYTVYQNSLQVVAMSTQIVNMQASILKLQNQVEENMDDRFRRRDWENGIAPLNKIILDHEKRLDTIEKTVHTIKERCKSC